MGVALGAVAEDGHLLALDEAEVGVVVVVNVDHGFSLSWGPAEDDDACVAENPAYNTGMPEPPRLRLPALSGPRCQIKNKTS
ncbi:hypothetical protein Lfu02_25380 [Longispora fulva]|nr:hypothetical protein Lfu02_25380 [Longispora fulva]